MFLVQDYFTNFNYWLFTVWIFVVQKLTSILFVSTTLSMPHMSKYVS